MGKVKPKEIHWEVWMRKMQSEMQLTRIMQMEIGADSNCAEEICSKKDCKIQAWLGHRPVHMLQVLGYITHLKTALAIGFKPFLHILFSSE